MSEANQETPEPQQQPKPHGKPLLIIPEQIAHLKAKGVTFNLCSDLVHKYGKPSDMPARVLMELFPPSEASSASTSSARTAETTARCVTANMARLQRSIAGVLEMIPGNDGVQSSLRFCRSSLTADFNRPQ